MSRIAIVLIVVRVDIASAEMNQGDDPDLVSLFLNPGSDGRWRQVDIATTGSHDIRLADLNGDGRVDMFGANWNMKLDPRGAPPEIWINSGRGGDDAPHR